MRNSEREQKRIKLPGAANKVLSCQTYVDLLMGFLSTKTIFKLARINSKLAQASRKTQHHSSWTLIIKKNSSMILFHDFFHLDDGIYLNVMPATLIPLMCELVTNILISGFDNASEVLCFLTFASCSACK